MRRLTLCLAIVFSFCQLSATNTATAATYYVDNTNGNDTYDGNQAKPWKTLDRTYTWYSGDGNKVQEGDTVLFRNGNYGTFSETSNYGASYLFYRNNWITYRAADGHTPTLNSIVIKNIDKWNGLGDGRSYLIIKGMNIQKGATIDHTSYVRVESCNITGDNDSLEGYNAPYNKPSGYGVGITYAQNIQVQNNEISYCYRGISVSSSTDINIVGNTIHRIGEDGMSIDAVNLLVEDNLIYDLLPERTIINIYGSQQGTFAVGEGVALQNTNARGIVYAVKPTYLQIYQTTEASFHSLWVAKTSDVLVGLTSGASIPDITNVDPSHCDGFQIMPGTVNATIQKNRIIRVVGGGEDGQGFKFDNPTGVNFVNNLIYTNVAHGSIITCTADVNLYNNTITGQLRIFAGHSAGTNRNTVVSNMYNNIIGSLSHEGDASGYTINVEHHGNNIFGNNPNGAPGPTHPFYVHTTEIASHNINSLFVNAANNDFNLAPNSAAINFGNPNYGPSSDILGHSRDSSPDAGCYEYVGSPPTSIGPPNADAGSDRTVTDSDQSGSEQVALDGSGSSGNIADSNYVWTWTTKDGNKSATGVKPTVSLPVGRYTITLTVTDNSGRTDTDTVVITVEVEEGLVGLWKFNEGSGSYANDSSGYSITGRLLNSPLWTSQGEISFDGYNDAVEVNTATLNISSGTVTLWVNPRGFSKSKHYLFGHLTQPANNRIQLFCNASGTLGVGLGNNASTNTNIGTLNTQEWYHIALTWSNTSYAVFVDGQQKDSGTFSGISAKQTYADIGNSGNKSQLSEAFYGLIDEVRLYDRALSANEVANHALVFLPIGDKIVAEGETLNFPVKTKFGTIVDISDNNLPHNPSFTSNIFTWTPGCNDAGTYEVEFTAPHGPVEDFERITVTVTDTQQQEPVGNWKFNELSGDIASDSSTTGNTGYLRNSLTWSSGVHNGAIKFSVPNDAVEIQTTKLNPQYGTIAMWVYMDNQTLSRHYLFGHASPTRTNRIQLYLKYGNLCLGLGGSHETRMDIQQLQTQQWYHIALTWNNGTYNVYVDGVNMATGTYSGLTGLVDHADIGNNGVTRDKALNGSIDDVMIYNRVLDAIEIASLAAN